MCLCLLGVPMWSVRRELWLGTSILVFDGHYNVTHIRSLNLNSVHSHSALLPKLAILPPLIILRLKYLLLVGFVLLSPMCPLID